MRPRPLVTVLMAVVSGCGGLESVDRPEVVMSDGLRLELASAKRIYRRGEKISVRVTVRNTASTDLVLPKLRQGLLEQYGIWHGWMIGIDDSAQNVYSHVTRRNEPLSRDDAVSLSPGEGFSVTVRVDSALRYTSSKGWDAGMAVGEVPGEYTVRARYVPVHSEGMALISGGKTPLASETVSEPLTLRVE